jgi:hypothetical protein
MANRHRSFHLVKLIQYLEEPLGYRFIDYQVVRKRLHLIQVLRMFYVSSGSREKLDCAEGRIALVDLMLEKQHPFLRV